jgi:DNA-binding SARP family transcriptional activator
MFSPHKPRADSKLKTLPRERQTEIADFARTHSLAETVQWLRQAGLSTSISAVSQFLRWCRLRQQAEQGESELRAAIADLARSDSISTADRLRHVGNIFFAGAALENQDAHAWVASQRVALREQELDLKHHQLAARLLARRSRSPALAPPPKEPADHQ